MNIDHRLELARQAVLAALPDRSQWSGIAATSLEQRLHELLAELDGIQGELWR